MQRQRNRPAVGEGVDKPTDAVPSQGARTYGINKSDHLSKTLLLFLFVYRVGSAVLLATSFNPDEYWQGLEPAHNAVFKYGYLTWEWREGLRSYMHPMLYIGMYEILRLTGLDTTSLLVRLTLNTF